MNRILLIEDDIALSAGIEYALKSEGFDVNIAAALEKARQLIKQFEYNLLLLDVMLPDGNGYDFCREVRRQSNIPIIFLTACDEEVNIVLGLDMGGDDYITKPFRLKELVSRINAILRRAGSSSHEEANLLVSGDIQIFTLEGRVKKNGTEIPLTALEYRLLLTMVKHPNQVLSRNSILEALWDFAGEFVDDNTLSVYVKRLREKIGDNQDDHRYITTIRGVGYKWDCGIRGEKNGHI
jgi:DNA-binding response OmpR family regulator